VTIDRPALEAHIPVQDVCCSPGNSCTLVPGMSVVRDAGWHRAARAARWLAWASLAWMCTEGGIGLWQGTAAGSIALTGWALGSAVEGLASVIVIWRFTGSRTLSETAERRAQRGVGVSFWLLAPYIAAESVHNLVTGHHADTSDRNRADRRRPAGNAAAGPCKAQARATPRVGRHRWGGHSELSVCYPGGSRAAGLGRYRRLARRLVAGPGHRPGHSRGVRAGGRRLLARQRLLLTATPRCNCAEPF
jgi:hypothetical protein